MDKKEKAATIFSVYNEDQGLDIISRSKSSSEFNVPQKVKSFEFSTPQPVRKFDALLARPKGLSVRSKSDLNVVTPSNKGYEFVDKTKLSTKDLDKFFPKKEYLSPKKHKSTPNTKKNATISLPPVGLTSEVSNVGSHAEEFVFKKPMTPKSLRKVSGKGKSSKESENSYFSRRHPSKISQKNSNDDDRKPESLAGYINEGIVLKQNTDKAFEDDLNFVRLARQPERVDSHLGKAEDEGFISDDDKENNFAYSLFNNANGAFELPELTLPIPSPISDEDDIN